MEADDGLAERMCIVTRETRGEAELIRFVRGPDGSVVPDLARKLPGRGVWVSLSRARLAEAVKKQLFSRGFAAETHADEGLPGLVARLLRQQALGLLALARKAGDAVTGFSKVEDMLARQRVAVLLHAAEAQPDGCRKLDRMAGPDVVKTGLFHSHELDLAFGRSNVIHAAVAGGGLAEKLRIAVQRIEMFEAPAGPKEAEERV
jgi:predicted RNA-binding protein YlxR (DUF448 family)